MSLDVSKVDPKDLEKVLAKLSPGAKKLVLQTIAELQDKNDSDTFELIEAALWKVRPPPIDEFVYGRQYLNIPKGQLYPAVEELIYLADNDKIREAFICAGKGSGKSSLTTILMARSVHKISYCMRDPSAFFKVLPGTSIAVLNMATSVAQAENVVFSKFWALLRGGRCFHNERGPTFNKKKRHIEFPNDTHALSGHSGYTSYFGYDLFAGIIDEFSFFKDTSDKSISEEIYSGIQGSCKTRFPRHYKIVGISTPASKECAIYKRVALAENAGVIPRVIGEDTDGGRVLRAEVDGDSYAKVVDG